MVRASSHETGDELIGTPADYVLLTLMGRPPSIGPVHNIQAHVSTEIVGSQSRVKDDADFVPSPDGYALLSAGVEAEVGKRQPVRVGVDVHNLLDTAYRDYNSLLRYYADQPGRDIRMRVGMDF